MGWSFWFGIMLIDVINIKLYWIFRLETWQTESLSFREKGHLLLQAKWCFQVTESLKELSQKTPAGSMHRTHWASTWKWLLKWDIFTKSDWSLRWPKWESFDMSEFVFLCTQLEKTNHKTNQPEARKPFVSISKAPNLGEGPMTTEALWVSFGLLLQLWYLWAKLALF